jgi:drug/metabolite transporter (DMT)-like permease
VTAAGAAPRDGSRTHAELALGAASVAVVAWSFGPIIVRTVGVSTPTVVFWRLWIAQPIMFAAAYLTGGRPNRETLRVAWPAGVLFGVSIVFGFASYQNTSVANATLIGSLEPALMLLIAPWLFGERSSARRLALAAVAFGGTVLLVLAASDTSGANVRGDLFAVVNLVLFTAYFARMKIVRDRGVHALSLLACVVFVAALTVTPWALLTSNDLGSVSLAGYGWLVLMVLGPGLAGHGSMTWAQRHLDITIASLITLASPVMSVVLAWMIYDERLTPLQGVGAAIVVVSLAAIVVDERSSSVAESSVAETAA